MSTYEQKIQLKFKLLSKIYGIMDLIYFSNKKSSPRYGLLNNISNKHQRLLDVCFGAGHSVILIAENKPNVAITGIDMSKDMLALARKNMKKENISGIETFEMDATQMDFGDETFDIVTISLSLHEMEPDIVQKTLAEIFRVLKKGGVFYITEWAVPRNFFKRIFFKCTIPIMEPGTFKDFMKINWNTFLTEHQFTFDRIDRYSYTQFIVATK
ncbi:MAG: methyltransferase domain-containing protein [Proteobacteria bacterium]|nr:methyltransferase domain-containing protein [Pseudomonadota bacterium]